MGKLYIGNSVGVVGVPVEVPKDSSADGNKDRMIITEIKTEPIPVEDN